MATFLELTQGTGKLLAQTEALFRKYDYQAAADNIKDQIKAFQERELTVVVAGEARRGKSSLLNALLNEKESIFPVDVNVCTNVVTILRYGEEERIEAYIEDTQNSQGYRVETIGRNEIENYVSEKGNPNNYKKVKVLKAFVPNELLKEGIVFVDTPGVGSLNVEHAEATYGFLPNADLLLFVTDTLAGMTETELDFLRRGYSYCKNVIFALTKKDLAENYETIVEDNRTKISAALEIPKTAVDVIPVSSRAKLRFLNTGRKAMYLNSNFQKLEECIWSTISRTRGEILLLPYLVHARMEIGKLHDNVVAQYQTLGSTVTADLIEELNKMIKKLDDLQDQGADWRSDLSLTFSLLQTAVNAEQQTIAQNARDLVDEQIRVLDKKICEPANYKRLISDVNNLITQGLLDIREKISDDTNSKMASLQNTLDLELETNESILSKLMFQPVEPEIQFSKKKTSDQLISKGRNISMNTMGGASVGSILGGIVGFCIGGPAGLELGAYIGGSAGTLFGGTKGCVEAFSKYDQLDINTVSKALNKHIASSMTSVSGCVSTVLTELRIAVTASFEKQLKKRVKELQENIAQLRKNISLAQNEIPNRQGELKAQLAQLKQVDKSYDTVMRAIANTDAVQIRNSTIKATDDAAEKLVEPQRLGEKTAHVDEKDAKQEEVTYAFL